MERRDADHCTKKADAIRLDGKRKQGRPQLRWHEELQMGMKEVGVQRADALGRDKWRDLTRMADPK